MEQHSNAIQLAVITEKVVNIKDSFEQHMRDDRDFQSKILNYLETGFKGINDKLDVLWDDKTRREGGKKSIGLLSKTIESLINIIISAITAYVIVKYGNK